MRGMGRGESRNGKYIFISTIYQSAFQSSTDYSRLIKSPTKEKARLRVRFAKTTALPHWLESARLAHTVLQGKLRVAINKSRHGRIGGNLGGLLLAFSQFSTTNQRYLATTPHSPSTACSNTGYDLPNDPRSLIGKKRDRCHQQGAGIGNAKMKLLLLYSQIQV